MMAKRSLSKAMRKNPEHDQVLSESPGVATRGGTDGSHLIGKENRSTAVGFLKVILQTELSAPTQVI